LPPSVPENWEVLVTTFSASPQLEERINQLPPPGQGRARWLTPEEQRARMEKMRKLRAEQAAKEKEAKERPQSQ
jgi:hypothetical protein